MKKKKKKMGVERLLFPNQKGDSWVLGEEEWGFSSGIANFFDEGRRFEGEAGGNFMRESTIAFSFDQMEACSCL